jgi:hypothetical protein
VDLKLMLLAQIGQQGAAALLETIDTPHKDR